MSISLKFQHSSLATSINAAATYGFTYQTIAFLLKALASTQSYQRLIFHQYILPQASELLKIHEKFPRNQMSSVHRIISIGITAMFIYHAYSAGLSVCVSLSIYLCVYEHASKTSEISKCSNMFAQKAIEEPTTSIFPKERRKKTPTFPFGEWNEMRCACLFKWFAYLCLHWNSYVRMTG